MRIVIVLILLLIVWNANGQPVRARERTLIVIFDGLRPDYITPERMPHLYALKQRGCYGEHNHSVFPTVTRVNASSYITGSYPKTHGLLGNTIYIPDVDQKRGLNTGDVKELRRAATALDGRLLTSISLGEVLRNAGSEMMVFSSGSSGQAFLQNHTISGGGIVHPEIIEPSDLKEDLLKRIGPPPTSAEPNVGQHVWATKALLHYGLADDGPEVSAIWYSDPDGSAHSHGIGSPLAMASIKAVDEQFGNIIKIMADKGWQDKFNIIVTADHGFVTDKGTVGLGSFLIANGLKNNSESDDVIVAGNALYIKGSDPAVIRKVVSTLQEQPWVGGIYTASAKGSTTKGWVDGTLSFEAIQWDHERAGDILVDYNWDDGANAFGYRGSSFATGVAGHGGASPYEIHIPLIASGPAFKSGFVSNIPTSNIDIAPTILKLLEIDIPSSMNGRVLHELLAKSAGSEKIAVTKEVLEATVKHSWGTYRMRLQRSIVGKHRYVDFAAVDRKIDR